MNMKKLLLTALIGLSTATVRPMYSDFTTEQPSVCALEQMPAEAFIGTTIATIVPSAAIGFGVGSAIASMAGTFFDAVMNQKTIEALAKFSGISNVNMAIAVNVARLGAQIGSKYFWGRPLRHKFMDYLITTMKAKGIEFDAELAKTTARVFDWLATANQVNTDYSLALAKSFLNQFNHPRIVIRN